LAWSLTERELSVLLYRIAGFCHSLLDLLLAEMKRNIYYQMRVIWPTLLVPRFLRLESNSYTKEITKHEFLTFPEVNRFTVKDYFDKLKELLMRLDIMDKPERICSADEKDTTI
jgi:hypothetical protein